MKKSASRERSWRRRNQSVRRGNKSETIKTFVNARGTLLLFNLKSREQILSEHTQQHPPVKINQPHEFLLHMKGTGCSGCGVAAASRNADLNMSLLYQNNGRRSHRSFARRIHHPSEFSNFGAHCCAAVKNGCVLKFADS